MGTVSALRAAWRTSATLRGSSGAQRCWLAGSTMRWGPWAFLLDRRLPADTMAFPAGAAGLPSADLANRSHFSQRQAEEDQRGRSQHARVIVIAVTGLMFDMSGLWPTEWCFEIESGATYQKASVPRDGSTRLRGAPKLLLKDDKQQWHRDIGQTSTRGSNGRSCGSVAVRGAARRCQGVRDPGNASATSSGGRR